jgi:hypothetical protein
MVADQRISPYPSDSLTDVAPASPVGIDPFPGRAWSPFIRAEHIPCAPLGARKVTEYFFIAHGYLPRCFSNCTAQLATGNFECRSTACMIRSPTQCDGPAHSIPAASTMIQCWPMNSHQSWMSKPTKVRSSDNRTRTCRPLNRHHFQTSPLATI